MLKSRYENIMFENDDLREKDYLDNLIYSQDLAEKITEYFNSEKNKPLYIAITGSWGSGKTTVATTAIKMIQEQMKVKFFSYDAWKYEGDSFRRTFTKNILDNSGISNKSEKYKNYLNKLYDDKSIETNSVKERIELSKHVDNEYPNWLLIIVAIFIFSISLLLSKYFSQEVMIACAMVISIFSSLGGIDFFTKLNKNFFDKFLIAKVTHVFPKLFSPEQFYNTVNDILNEVKEPNKIILIDNIDRCNMNEFKETISSIKGFFNEKGKIVYLIPFDIEQFNIAFNQEYQSYSEKIFDYTIDIKEKSQKNIIDFVDKLLLNEKGYSSLFPNESIDIIAKSGCKTPRQIINICNDYITEYNLFILKNKIELKDISKDDLNYLMKYTILKKYHKVLFNETHLKTDIIRQLEKYCTLRKDYDTVKEQYLWLKQDTYLFLRKTSVILPSNYDYFYSSQSKDDFEIDETILNAIQSEEYELVNSTIKNNQLKKEEFLKYMKKSIMYDKNRALWKINIAPKMRLIIYLLKEKTITIEEIDENLDFLIKDSYYFENLIFNREIDIEQIIDFINIVSQKFSKKYGLKTKLISGLVSKKFKFQQEEELDIISLIFSKLDINKLSDLQEDYFIVHMDKIVSNQKFKNSPHSDIISSKLKSYITVAQIKKMFDYTNNNDTQIYKNLVNLVKNLSNDLIDNELVVKFINFINRVYTYIKDETIFYNIFEIFYENKDNPLWSRNISTLNISSISKDYYNCETIKIIINLYEIFGNNNLKSILLSLCSNENVSLILNNINEKDEINNNLNSLIKDVINKITITEFEENINIIAKLYCILDSSYKNWFNQVAYSKFADYLEIFYNKLSNHEDKELFADYIVNLNMNFTQRLNRINFFTTSDERFNKILDGQNELTNLELILNKTNNSHYKNITISKMAGIIEGKASIINHDLTTIINIMGNNDITLQNKKILLVSLGVQKTNPTDLRKIYDVLNPSVTIKKEYDAIESILSEHNLLDEKLQSNKL